MKKPSLSERVRNPWKRLIEVHETQVSAERKNPSRGRVSGSRCKCIKQVHESSELKGVSRISIESIIVTALRTTDGRWEIEFSFNSAYEHKDVIDIDCIIKEFACLKGRNLALCL